MRFGRFGERVALADADLNRSAGHDVEEGLRGLHEIAARGDVGGERGPGQEQASLCGEHAEIDPFHLSRRVAVAHHEAARCQTVEAGVEGVTAGPVIDHVGHRALGHAFDVLRELVGSDQNVVRAMCYGELLLFFGRDNADDVGAEVFGPLTENEPDAAGGGMNDDHVTIAHAVGAMEQILRRHALQHHRRRLIGFDRVRQDDDPIGGHVATLGVGSKDAAVGDTVTRLDVDHAAADRLDQTGTFHADDRRETRIFVEAGPEINVDEVYPDGKMADQEFARPRGRARHVFPQEDLGTAIGVNADGFRHVGLRSPRKIAT